MSILDALAVGLALAAPVTDETPPGAIVHEGYAGGAGSVFWASCRRCAWWASDDRPGDHGFVTEEQAIADAARHNATITVHARPVVKGHTHA